MTYRQVLAPAGAHAAAGETARFLGRLLHLDDHEARPRIALTGRSGVTSQLSYGELAASVRAVSAGLTAAGLRPGDRVVLAAGYCPAWVAALLGVLSAGAVAVPIDPNLAAAELAPLLRDADPALVFLGPDNERQVRSALDLAGVAAPSRPLPDPPPAVAGDPSGPGDPDSPVPAPRLPADPAVIVYTSGATGAPKGVVISWANLMYQVVSGVQQQRAADCVVFVSILPPHHALELTAGCLGPLYAGGRVHYPGSMLPADIMTAVAEHRASDLVVVPLFLTAVKRRLDAELTGAAALRRAGLAAVLRVAGRLPFPVRRLALRRLHARFGGRLHRFLVGGAPLDPELARYFGRLGFHVCQGYGLTEASPIVSANTPWASRLGSCGRTFPGTEVRIGADGEIQVRGPGVMLGYWRRSELTGRTVDPDGWLHTGDTGYLDPDGYLFVTGRAKNLIVLPNGENVQPEELESVLGRSGLIGGACVLGLPTAHRRVGEQVVAVVTASEQARTSLPDPAERSRALTAEVRRLTRELASYKRPSRIVVHDGELPQTPTRKVRRAAVQELLNETAGSDTA